jgi:glycine/D-amino acid oxidase-like deaminating enzyme
VSLAPNTLWRHTAGNKPEAEQLVSDLAADVAVIGGGFTGLSTALHLARGGAKVVLLEAETLGWGASGRNAGFVVPNFSKADPASVIKKLGQERGHRLLDVVGRGADRVFEIAAAAGMGRQAEQNGWLQPAHTSEMVEVLQRRVAAWQALGRPVEWLDAAETARRTGMTRYKGALTDRSGGVINPLLYVFALARLAQAAGARLFENAPVSNVEADGAGWRVQSGSVTVRAHKVVLCTNGETRGVARKIGRAVVPLSVYQIATKPLPADVVKRFSPGREPVGDTRNNLFTYRLDADNRLISGGMALVPIAAEARMAKTIARRLANELSLGSVPEVEFSWRGTAAMTTDFLPHVYQFGPGFLGAVGCNGRGVAMTGMLGEVLAQAILQNQKPDDLPVPLASAFPIPFHLFARAAPSVVLAQGMLSDRRTAV